jgi:hypothetical protein
MTAEMPTTEGSFSQRRNPSYACGPRETAYKNSSMITEKAAANTAVNSLAAKRR